MRPPAVLLTTVLLAVVAVAVAITVARAEVYQNNYRSPLWGVEFTVPRDWELSEQVSYPGILAYATHHKLGGRMTLSAQRLDPDESVRTYMDRNEKALRQIGYQVNGVTRCRSSSPMLEAFTPDRKKRLVQTYLSHEGTAYVLTLAAPPRVLDEYLGAYCDTLGSVAFFTVAAPEAPASKRP